MSAQRTEQPSSRVDWPMRQFVDGIKSRLAAGEKPHDLRVAMYRRGVPHHVRFRILGC